MTKTREEAFWEKVAVRGPDDCWLWQGAITDNYGQFCAGNKTWMRAHRFSWILHNGAVPEGLLIRHLCESRYMMGDMTCRRCCNPAHLEAGTKLQNSRDCMAANRVPKSTRFKYSDEQVLLCITFAGRGRTEISRLLGITPRMVRYFVSGKKRARNAEFSKERGGC